MRNSKGRIVIDTYDNGGETVDRYTMAVTGIEEVNGRPYTIFCAASEHPFHPQGAGVYGSGEILSSLYNYSPSYCLGKHIDWFDLPYDVRRFFASVFMPDEAEKGE